MIYKPLFKLAAPLLACIFYLPETIGSDLEAIVELYKTRTSNGKHDVLIVSDFNGVLYRKEKGHTFDDHQMTQLRNQVIEPITKQKHIKFYVSSSKPANQLNDILGQYFPSLGLSAEHSMQVKHPNKDEFVDYRGLSITTVKPILDSLSENAKAKGFMKKDTTHEFSRSYTGGNAQGDKAWFKQLLREEQSRKGQKDILEAVFDDDNHKVMVAPQKRGKEHLVEALLKQKWQFAMALGDKGADLAMQQAMRDKGFIGIIVGQKAPLDKKGLYYLDNTEEVHELLKRVAPMYQPKRK